jgi:acyl-CoA reductase-like NAD-dependent aldehyde dehydrogenase
VSKPQAFVKKVVCEMGGKNAILVDQSADLDEAVMGVRPSTASAYNSPVSFPS